MVVPEIVAAGQQQGGIAVPLADEAGAPRREHDARILEGGGHGHPHVGPRVGAGRRRRRVTLRVWFFGSGWLQRLVVAAVQIGISRQGGDAARDRTSVGSLGASRQVGVAAQRRQAVDRILEDQLPMVFRHQRYGRLDVAVGHTVGQDPFLQQPRPDRPEG